MLEKNLEKRFREGCKKIGALTFKFVSPAQRGVPDRIVIHNGKVCFVELKTYNGRLTELQKMIHGEIETHGGTVFTLYGKEQVDIFIAGLR